MKLSETTSAILENFSKINGGIVIDPGQLVRTISPVGNLLASANVDEDFPSQVRIYNLVEFLNIKSLFNNAELVISDKQIKLVTDVGSGATIVQSTIDAINSPKGNPPKLDVLASFSVPNNVLHTIPKMQLTLNNVAIVANGENVLLKLSDLKNSSSTVLEFNVGKTDKVFEAHALSETFGKVLKTDSEYIVEVTEKFLHVKNSVLPLQYWIILEQTSKMK